MSHKKFYKECKELNIDKLKNKSQYEKAKIIAKKYSISEDQIEKIISKEREAILKAETERAARKAFKQQFEKDSKEQQKMLTKYPYFGAKKRAAKYDKKIEALNKKIKEIDEKISSFLYVKNDLANPSKITRSKQDWAISGGIASALAGPVAGIAVASQMIENNKKIEQQNRENIRLAAKCSVTSEIKISELKKERKKVLDDIKDIEEEIKRINIQLVQGLNKETAIDLFEISNVELTKSNLTLFISLKQAQKIFDDVDAVIDGAFWAHIYQEKNYIGSVRVILPADGIDTKLVKISVSTSIGIDPDVDFQIEYETERLWLIERSEK